MDYSGENSLKKIFTLMEEDHAQIIVIMNVVEKM